MIIFVFILLMIIFLDMKTAKSGELFTDYMSREKTTAINGIFTILVLLSHASGYIKLDGAFDAPYVTMKSYLGQMVVSTFLFYSGFGICESIKKKGMSYVKSIPFRRFFSVLYHSWIAVFLFVIVRLLLGKTFSVKEILLALTFWEGVGNSNWYIFVILCLYLIVFVSFLVTKANKYLGTVLTTVLSVVLVYLLIRSDRGSWWYNTIILYPCGMIFSLFKDKFDKIVLKNDLTYFGFAGVVLGAYYFCYTKKGTGIEGYSLWAIMFVMLILTLSMKVSINNGILQWFGTHVFSVYILQRIPMIVFTHFGLNTKKYAFVAMSFLVTIVLAVFFDAAMAKLDEVIYKKKS